MFGLTQPSSCFFLFKSLYFKLLLKNVSFYRAGLIAASRGYNTAGQYDKKSNVFGPPSRDGFVSGGPLLKLARGALSKKSLFE